MTRYLPWLAVALLLWQARCAGVRQGELQAQLRVLATQADSLRAESTRLDTVYRADTVRLTRWRTAYDTLYADRQITDTVWVKRFVVTADSTIKSCSAALGTCEAATATLRSRIGNLDSTLALERRRRPSRLGCTAGPSATTKGIGVGVTCGVRVP